MFIEFEITQPIIKVQTPLQPRGVDGKFLRKNATVDAPEEIVPVNYKAVNGPVAGIGNVYPRTD